MSFLFPAFFGALTVLVIPVIIHFFYFRRFKTIYFTNVRFLQEVLNETAKRRNLRELLVLASRVLALAALVTAFAQPYFSKINAKKKGYADVSIYIDNSFSMAAGEKQTNLLETAKQNARDIIKAYSINDKFNIITNDFEAKHQFLNNKEAVLNQIDEIKISPSVQKISAVIRKQQQIVSSGKNNEKIFYNISDFQKTTADVNAIVDTFSKIKLIPLKSVEQRNISIDSVWFESPIILPNQTATLIYTATNHADANVNDVKLSINLDGQTRPAGLKNFAANAIVRDSVKISVLNAGWHTATLNITDYPIQFDDNYFFSFYAEPNVKVLHITDVTSASSSIESALKVSKNFIVNSANSNNLRYAQFPENKLIVLEDVHTINSGLSSELLTFIKNGGNVLIFPEANADLNSYNTFLNNAGTSTLSNFEIKNREVSAINASEFIFKDVYTNLNAALTLPSTNGNFKFVSKNSEALLSYRDGSVFLSKTRIQNGNLYVCSAPLNAKYSNLTRTGEVFVPLLNRSAISGSQNRKNAFTIGTDKIIDWKTENLNIESADKLKLKLVSSERDKEFIPDFKFLNGGLVLNVGNEIKSAGTFTLKNAVNDSTYGVLAFNYNRQESPLKFYTSEELKKSIRPNVSVIEASNEVQLANFVKNEEQPHNYWQYFLIAAIAFLIIETLLLRYMK